MFLHSQNLELGTVPTLFTGRNGPEKQSDCRVLGAEFVWLTN